MVFSVRVIRLSDDVNVSNTQLAAALVALGYELLPSTDFNQADVTFMFEDCPTAEMLVGEWGLYLKNDKRLANDPLAIMFGVSKARQWMLDRVIHGNHNQDMELPLETMATTDFRFAVCLVALQCYLLKLDKPNKTFYFTPSAGQWKKSYDRPTEGSQLFWARQYLRALDELVFRIHGRYLARQGSNGK